MSYRARMARRDRGRVVFVDESGVNIAMTRRYARAQGGQRAYGSVPKNWGENVTVLAAMGLEGVTAAMTVNGATDADVFVSFLHEVLVPTLSPGDVVVMDNLGAHKSSAVAAAIDGAGAEVLYLPPYSPDLSPIERCWSKLKAYLRGAKARTREALDNALTRALKTISAEDAAGWFRLAGYPVQP